MHIAMSTCKHTLHFECTQYRYGPGMQYTRRADQHINVGTGYYVVHINYYRA